MSARRSGRRSSRSRAARRRGASRPAPRCPRCRGWRPAARARLRSASPASGQVALARRARDHRARDDAERRRRRSPAVKFQTPSSAAMPRRRSVRPSALGRDLVGDGQVAAGALDDDVDADVGALRDVEARADGEVAAPAEVGLQRAQDRRDRQRRRPSPAASSRGRRSRRAAPCQAMRLQRRSRRAPRRCRLEARRAPAPPAQKTLPRRSRARSQVARRRGRGSREQLAHAAVPAGVALAVGVDEAALEDDDDGAARASAAAATAPRSPRRRGVAAMRRALPAARRRAGRRAPRARRPTPAAAPPTRRAARRDARARCPRGAAWRARSRAPDGVDAVERDVASSGASAPVPSCQRPSARRTANVR